jgi:hypothetical protein
VERTLYLHIGSEKTGTSSLRQFLANNSEQLNRAGFTYFTENKLYYSEHRNAHSPIVASFFHEPPDFVFPSEHVPNQDMLSRFKKDLSNEERNVILSSEHFSSRLTSRDHIEKLRDALDAFDVYIIFYMREQYELYYASYSTAIINGRREKLTDDPVHIDNGYLNYYKLLEPWACVFGKESIVVRDYSKMVNNDICDDFARLLGVHDTSRYKKVLRTNKSLTPQRAEMIRELNALLPHDKEVGYLTNFLLIQLRWLVNSFLGLFYRDDRMGELPMKSKIRSTFDQSNKALFGTYASCIKPKESDVLNLSK